MVCTQPDTLNPSQECGAYIPSDVKGCMKGHPTHGHGITLISTTQDGEADLKRLYALNPSRYFRPKKPAASTVYTDSAHYHLTPGETGDIDPCMNPDCPSLHD